MAEDVVTLALRVANSQAMRACREFSGETMRMTDVVKQSALAVSSLFMGAKAVAWGKKLIESAAQAQEAAGILNDVFAGNKELLAQASEHVKTLANNYAYSTAEATNQLSMTADTFKKFGVEARTALDLSFQINKIGGDLAAFTNYIYGSEGATEALSKALLGEREMAKSLGIVITEEMVKQEIQAQKVKGVTYATEQQAKMMATLAMIQRQSASAQDKAIKEAGNYSMMIKNLGAHFTDLKAAIGKHLIDPFSNVIAGAIKTVDWFKNIDEDWQKVIVRSSAAAAGYGLLRASMAAVMPIIAAYRAATASATQQQVVEASAAAGGAEAHQAASVSVGNASAQLNIEAGSLERNSAAWMGNAEMAAVSIGETSSRLAIETVVLRQNSLEWIRNAEAVRLGAAAQGTTLLPAAARGAALVPAASQGAALLPAAAAGTAIVPAAAQSLQTIEVSSAAVAGAATRASAATSLFGRALAGIGPQLRNLLSPITRLFGMLFRLASPVLALGGAAMVVLGPITRFVEGIKEVQRTGNLLADTWNGLKSGMKNIVAANKYDDTIKNSVDPFERGFARFKKCSLGMQEVAESFFESIGLLKKTTDILARIPIIHWGNKADETEFERQAELDRQAKERQEKLKKQENVHSIARYAQDSEGMEKDLKNADAEKKTAGMEGAEQSFAELQMATQKWSEASERLANLRGKAEELAAAKKEMDTLEEQGEDSSAAKDKYFKLVQKSIDEGFSLEQLNDAINEEKNASINLTAAKKKMKDEEEKLANQLKQEITDKEREKNETERDQAALDLERKYKGDGNDFTNIAKSNDEMKALEARLEESAAAKAKISLLDTELENGNVSAERRMEIMKEKAALEAVALTDRERIALEGEILNKERAVADAEKKIADDKKRRQEEEERRTKEYDKQREANLEERSLKEMNEQEKVAFYQERLNNLASKNEYFEKRAAEIEEWGARIEELQNRQKSGDVLNSDEEKELDDLLDKREKAEEELFSDRMEALRLENDSINAIDEIANSRAEKEAQRLEDYIKKSEKRSGPVSASKAVDASSSEAFVQMTKIYDVSQKRIEDHTKNISENTRVMKSALLQLAAQGNSDWALEIA